MDLKTIILETIFTDEYFMREALKEAKKGIENDEVPVGAVVVCNDKVIARAFNQTEQLHDCTAHAEMIAITSAANFLGSKYLKNCKLYVTLEPCVMCAGALQWSQISEIIFAATDEKRGYQKISDKILHPKTTVKSGILKEEASKIMIDFFQKKRD